MNTIKVFNESNNDKLEYVSLVAKEFIKSSGTETNEIFQRLYNNRSGDWRTSLYPLSLEDFESDTYKEVRDTLTKSGLDLEKLWYLLLFTNDYIRRKLWQETSLSAMEEVDKFKKRINKYLPEIDITIRRDNQPILTIKNKEVISYIADKCNPDELSSNKPYQLLEHKVDRTYMFYEMLLFFLKQKLTSSIIKEIHPAKIISALLYLTKLNTDERLIEAHIYKNCKGRKTTVLSGLKSGGKWINIPAYPYEEKLKGDKDSK